MILAPSASGQSVQVGATGIISVSYQPSSGGVVTQVQPVAGSSTLALPGVGTAQLTVGATSTLTLTADSPPWGCYGCWSQAMGDVRLAVSAATPIAVVLRLSVVPACWMGMPPTLDVNDDGSYELVGLLATQTLDVPVVLGTEPVPVRMGGNAVNFGGANCTATLTVSFLAQPSQLAPVQAACGPDLGAVLTADGGARTLSLRIGSMSGLIGALGVGDGPIPGTGCGLAMLPLAVVWIVPSPAAATYVVPIAPAVAGVFTLQYAELLATGSIAFSNGIVATL